MHRAGRIPDGSTVHRDGGNKRISITSFMRRRRRGEGLQKVPKKAAESAKTTTPSQGMRRSQPRQIVARGLTASDVLRFLSKSTAKHVDLKSDSANATVSIGSFIDTVNRFKPLELLTDDTDRLVACRVEDLGPRLTVEYTPVFASAVFHLLEHPEEMPGREELRRYYEICTRFSSHHAAGIRDEEIREAFIAHNQLALNTAALSNVCEWYEILLLHPLDDLRLALGFAAEQKTCHPPAINTRVIAAAGTIKGTAKGLLVSAFVNSLIDSYNEDAPPRSMPAENKPLASYATQVSAVQLLILQHLQR
jgi:hypothetical protein